MTGTPINIVARGLQAPVLVVAFAVLLKGGATVGDGFSAGLIVATGVLIHYVAFGRSETERRLPVIRAPRVAQAGLLLIFAIALQSLLRGESLLVHAPAEGTEPVSVGVAKLTTGLLFELGIFLIVAGVIIALVHSLAVVATEGEEDESR